MKRLISWLLALTLIFGLMPLSAFAVEVDTDGTYDEDVDFGELVKPEVGTAENPEEVIWVKGAAGYTATVTVAANKTHYFYFTNNAQPTMVLTANDEVVSWVPGNPRMGQPSTFCLTNGSDAEVTYALTLGFPAGDMMNPVVIEDMNWYNGEVSQAEGDNDGFYYTYTATETGIVTLYFDAVYDENYELVENVGIRDITVTNMSTYAQYTLQGDGVDNNGLELNVPVVAGQELQIITSWVEDAEGNSYPEATYSWTGNFSYPAGSDKNPIQIDWNWDENMANGTATVEVAADGTYFYGENGMILTANGTEIAQENGIFVLNAGTYNLVLTTPVGQNVNPEVIADINGNFSGNLAEGAEGYYYIWTATEDGTVTLDVTDGANIKVVHFGDTVSYDDGESQFEYVEENYYQLATAIENEETWALEGWDVAENISFEVKAGHSVKIQVVALEVGNWEKPAISYTLTGAFEKAITGPAVDENLKFMTKALSFQEEIVYQCIFNTGSVTGYDSFYVECTHYDPVDGEYTETLAAKKMGTRLQFKKNFLSWSMVDEIKITLYGVKGEEVYMGESFVTSVRAEALNILESKKATDAKTCRVLVDMLNYGAEVQKAFKHNAENPANKDLGEFAEFGTSETPAYSAQTERGTASTVRVNSLGISMQSKVEYQLVLNGANENHELRAYNGSTLYATVPYADFVPRGNFRQAKLAIKAADMRTALKIAVYDKTTGEPVSEIITTCAEAFASANIGEGKTYNDVFIAMLKYGDAVSALLAK